MKWYHQLEITRVRNGFIVQPPVPPSSAVAVDNRMVFESFDSLVEFVRTWDLNGGEIEADDFTY